MAFCFTISAEELRSPPEPAESSDAIEQFQIVQAELAAKPDDADTWAQLGSSCRELGDPVSAARLYRKAAEAALDDGRIRFTRELSELFVELHDLPGLISTFTQFMDADSGHDLSEKYLAMVDFADGLASLDDESAWAVFEESLLLTVNNIEAINRYSAHLFARHRYVECLNVLNRLTPEQRARSILPAQMYRECEKGLSHADDDTKRSSRVNTAQFGVVLQGPINQAISEKPPQ